MKITRNKSPLLIILLTLITACSEQKRQITPDISSVDMRNTTEIEFDTLVEDVSCVVLEDLPDAFLNDCWKIIKYTDFYYLYSLSDFTVCIFDMQGHFVRRIDSRGKGGIETPCDIFINEKYNQLWILESRLFINKYTLKGEFVEQEKLPFSAVKMSYTSGYFLFYDGGFDENYPYYIRQTTPDYTTMNEFSEKSVESNKSIPVSLFTHDESKKNIYTLLPYNDTIYISNINDNFTPFMILNFHGDLLTFKDLPKGGFNDKEIHEIINDKEKIYDITGFNFVSGMLFMKLEGKDHSFLGIDLTSKTAYKFNSLINNVSLNVNVTTFQGSSNSSLLISLPLENLTKAYSKHHNQTKYKAIKNLMNDSLSPRSRVLIEIKLKNRL